MKDIINNLLLLILLVVVIMMFVCMREIKKHNQEISANFNDLIYEIETER